MGKKGSWFSAIKRVFIPNSKEKLVNGSDRKSKEKKKKGLGKLRHTDGSSFIPLFREPSSIEKILGEAEREHQRNIVRPATPSEQPITRPSIQPQPPALQEPQPLPLVHPSLQAQPSFRHAQPLVKAQSLPQSQSLPTRVASPRVASPRVASPRAASPRAASPRAASPRAASPRLVHNQKDVSYRRTPTLWNHNVAAIRIQAAYRGYVARRSFRALRGLVRLQGVVRGQNVKRQTSNAMKYMQLLVRVQSQIRSRRIQMLENQALKNDKEVESLGKWGMSQQSEAGNNEDWDDSQLTKEEIEARLRRKAEAVMKRERAMAYAYSHQSWKSTLLSAQSALMDFRTGGFPWWWNWLERELPSTNPPEIQGVKNVHLTPPRPHMEQKPSPRQQAGSYRQQNMGLDHHESLTPRSSRSPLPARAKLMQTPSPFNRFSQTQSPSFSRYSKARASAADSTFDAPLKDDDSLTSCPPFSVPNYMSPTVSAKAKARANFSYRLPSPSPSDDPKRRLSFPLTQGVGSFKWNKGSPFHGKESPSQKVEKGQSLQSLGNLSVDSTTSLPAGLGRKPFNRFV